MTIASPPLEDAALVAELCAQSTTAAQVAFLQAAGLLNESGLSRLLDLAADLTHSDPGRARDVATTCINLADPAGTPRLIPRARYIQAQTHAANGEFSTALTLTQSAHDGYVRQGDDLQALRTNVGRMHVLIELGRHQDALAVGQSTLERLKATVAHNGHNATQTKLLAALVHHNRGICYRRMGRYEDALQAYAAAETRYVAGDMPARLGEIHNNRGLILLHLGRINDALAAFAHAADLAEQVGRTVLHVEALINSGEAHQLLGNFTRSLAALAQADDLLEAVEAQANRHFVRLHRADVYLALNLYPEALADYRDAMTGFRTGEMTHYQARALWGMGAALAAQSQFEEAEQALAEAAELFAAAENAPMLCSVRLEQAALQATQGERERALATAGAALDLVSEKNAWPVQQIYARLRLADLLMPDTGAAEPHLLAAQQLSESLVFPQLHYRLVQRLGHLRRQQGRVAEAEALLEEAIAGIERMRGTVAQESMRVSFLHDKIAAYEDLLQLRLDQGEARRAFAVAEQAKSRALVDLLTGVTAPPSPDDPDVAEQLQTLQAELNAIYSEFLGGRQAQDIPRPELHARAQELEQTIRRLRLQAPAQEAATDPFTAALPLADVRRHLPDDLALLAYHVVGEEIMAFVVADGQVHVVRRLSDVPTVQAKLQRLNAHWQRFRAGPDFVRRHTTLLTLSAQRLLGELHAALVAPLAGTLPAPAGTDPHPLTIIPHGLLHQVPFHALWDGARYLLEHYTISYAPSATVLALCQQQERTPAGEALIGGVSDSLIPAVKTEVNAVARQLPNASVRLDDALTTTSLPAAVAGCNLVHLACHGLFRADNPMFSALKLYNGWLTAADAMALTLPAALVTLSACESGVSHVTVGDEVIGLTRAFLGAGAATLVVSLWLVQDETTADLMSDWYARMQAPDTGRVEALRAAQLALKADYPHPYYWAPFVLVGQR